MNAVLCEEYEALVLTNEAIEVHLSYLQPAVEAVQAELPALREKIEALDEKLNGKIDTLNEQLTGKIDALDDKLTGKIDALDKKLSDKFDQKIDKLTEQLMKLQASQDGFKWFIGSLTVLGTGARSLTAWAGSDIAHHGGKLETRLP
jgi:chromosome segregation ATPase